MQSGFKSRRRECCLKSSRLPPAPPLPRLQVRVSEFTQLRSALQAQARKAGGSLAVRDLAGAVAAEKLVDTDNLATLLAVVPKGARAEWLASYEQLSDYVVGLSGGAGCWRAGGAAGGGRGLQSRGSCT